jgi:truncated hemoglobin YjbI
MAWKPFYERAAEIESAAEQEAFLRGVLGGPKPLTPKQAAGAALIAVLAGWTVNSVIKGSKR